MRKINLIVVHCAATPDGKDITIEDIDRMHQQRGFERAEGWRKSQNYKLRSVGYHYFIRINGLIQSGRHHGEIGAHAGPVTLRDGSGRVVQVLPGNNQRSLGICLAGTERFTRLQWDALKTLHGTLSRQYPQAQWCGHRDLSPDKDRDGVVEPHEWLKTCPGFDVKAWIARGLEPLPEDIYVPK